jgi:hypothetical protein
VQYFTDFGLFLFEAKDNELKITASAQGSTMSITVTPNYDGEGGAIAFLLRFFRHFET